MRAVPNVVTAEELDEQLALTNHVAAFEPTMFAWSRTIRQAVGLTLVGLGDRLGISQPAASKLELHEADGSISLAKLEKLAEALDCRLVYGFVPIESFVDTAEYNQRLQDKARRAKRKIPRIK